MDNEENTEIVTNLNNYDTKIKELYQECKNIANNINTQIQGKNQLELKNWYISNKNLIDSLKTKYKELLDTCLGGISYYTSQFNSLQPAEKSMESSK